MPYFKKPIDFDAYFFMSGILSFYKHSVTSLI